MKILFAIMFAVMQASGADDLLHADLTKLRDPAGGPAEVIRLTGYDKSYPKKENEKLAKARQVT